MLAAAVGCSGAPSVRSEPSSSVDSPTSSSAVVEAVPGGFELTAARVTTADGRVCELCLWLADSPQQRNRGLMSVTDLGPADGMAFRYPRPTTTRFWMKNTLLPLSIAFYGPDRMFLDSFDMEPCVTGDCVRYPTPADFVVAVETYRGDLAALGMVADSSLELLDLPCKP